MAVADTGLAECEQLGKSNHHFLLLEKEHSIVAFLTLAMIAGSTSSCLTFGSMQLAKPRVIKEKIYPMQPVGITVALPCLGMACESRRYRKTTYKWLADKLSTPESGPRSSQSLVSSVTDRPKPQSGFC
jgi:hypothetical protein